MGMLLNRPQPGNIIVGQEYENGNKQIITGNTEQAFHLTKQALGNEGIQTLTQVPDINPVSSVSFRKIGDRIIKRGSSANLDISRNSPLFNDPRYTSSTLAIPTDDRTLHGLYRFFKDTDPIVSAAIRVHSEMPLANLELGECEDSGVQTHFEEMCDRINLHRTIGDAVNEFWTIGNDYLFGAWNEKDYMWDQFTLLNPDYVKIESTWLNQKPLVKLIPDENLKKIVQTRSPEYLYKQLSPDIIRYVLYNNEIPLHPNNIFILSHDKAPYEVKGKSIIKRILKTLMYEDRLQQAQFAIATRHIVPLTVVKLGDPATGWVPSTDEMEAFREMLAGWEMDPNFCYDEKTECLTKNGWKKYTELTHDTEIASFNSETSTLEYHKPQAINIQDYDDMMYHFIGKNYDIKVTPNHRMWVKRNNEWQIVLAEDVKPTDQIRNVIDNYVGDELPEYLEIAGEQVKTEDWFEFAGWYLSEGSSYFDVKYNTQYSVTITQMKQLGRDTIVKLLDKLPWNWNLHAKNSYTINGKKFANYVVEQLGKLAEHKKLPIWMLTANKKYLMILLHAWLLGDGTQWKKKDGLIFYKGYSTSKQLAEAMQEIAFKCGYYVKIRKQKTESYIDLKTKVRKFARVDGTLFSDLYVLHISTGKKSSFPFISNKDAIVEEIDFSDIDRNQLLTKTEKRIDWNKIDLPNLLHRTYGNVRYISKLLNVSAGTIWNQLEKENINPNNYGEKGIAFEDGYIYKPSHIVKEYYQGKIWCVTVPPGIIVTRRNGKIAIQGQSIIYHYGIDIQFYGASGKILPTGPEFDRIYKLKFIGMGIHEQLMTGAGGSYAQAYANLEIQRQRYLNLQLKIEQMVHIGWFKTVAEMCGFYRMSQPVVGSYYRGKKYGSVKEAGMDLMKNFSHVRDYQDNNEFKEFFTRKATELKNQELTQRREYIYPKLDWGAMSATNDENYKNYIKWLREKVPYLVDESTLARIGRLDQTSQEKAYIRDLQRKKRREEEIVKLGLSAYVDKKPGDAGAMGGDFGGGPQGMDIGPLTPNAPDMTNMPEGEGGGGPTALPVGAGGAPSGAATGAPPPMPTNPGHASKETTNLEAFSEEVYKDNLNELDNIQKENRPYVIEKKTIDKVVGD